MDDRLQADAELATRIVREAGALARDLLAAGLSAQRKTSVSDVVTAADHAAEELVVEILTRERPADAIVGEEGAARAGTSGRTWVVDPVDGTYNFVRGLDWWCSALALRADDVLLGAVHQPATGTTYVGGPSLPSTRGRQELPRIEDRSLAESCLATYLHPPFFGTEVAAAFGRMANASATIRMLGSGSMDAMAVADGRLDVLCQHSVPEWDELPGAAIIRGAGGSTRRVRAAGVDWYVAGAPTAVDHVCAALLDR